MKRSPAVHVAALLLTAAPLAFGAIRAVRVADLRYLWMALAALLGATIVMAAGKARTRTLSTLIAVAAIALLVATFFAGLTAQLLQGTTAPVTWVVAFVFGCCCAAGRALSA